MPPPLPSSRLRDCLPRAAATAFLAPPRLPSPRCRDCLPRAAATAFLAPLRLPSSRRHDCLPCAATTAFLATPRLPSSRCRGVGGPSPPPRARRAAIAFGRAVSEEEPALMARVSTGGVGRGVARLPMRQVVDCPRVDGWCRSRCSIAHALTGGIGVSAWAVPSPPPPALVVPLAQRLWMSGRGFFFFIPPFPLSINVNFCYCVLSFFFSIV